MNGFVVEACVSSCHHCEKRMSSEKKSTKTRPIVIKVGTSSLLNGETGCLSLGTVSHVVETVVSLKRSGRNVVLVTSGSGTFCKSKRTHTHIHPLTHI
jgi:hypothetical protein